MIGIIEEDWGGPKTNSMSSVLLKMKLGAKILGKIITVY
jgi:hypothetical protein